MNAYLSPSFKQIVSIVAFAALIVVGFLNLPEQADAADADEQTKLAEWGEDHVGKPFPMYVTGGECLFCHRYEVGSDWQTNRHNLAMQEATPDEPAMRTLREAVDPAAIADEVQYLVGDTRMKRYLKPNGRYGQMSILDTKWIPPVAADDTRGRIEHARDPHWNEELFANQCAGCHATAVETEIRGFQQLSLDCFVCHGDVPKAHNEDTSLALFGTGSKAGAPVEMHICSQCHLRGGVSQSTGLPYPNQFVPGDNLFKDFLVDLSADTIAEMNPADRHVFQNVRDVLIGGQEEMTCVSCHEVHTGSTRKHRTLRRLQRDVYCAICHDNAEDYTSLIAYDVHNETCDY